MFPTAFTSDVTTVATFAAVREVRRTYRRLCHLERVHPTDARASLAHPIAAANDLIGPRPDALFTFEESLLDGLDQARRSSIENGLHDLLMSLKNAP